MTWRGAHTTTNQFDELTRVFATGGICRRGLLRALLVTTIASRLGAGHHVAYAVSPRDQTSSRSSSGPLPPCTDILIEQCATSAAHAHAAEALACQAPCASGQSSDECRACSRLLHRQILATFEACRSQTCSGLASDVAPAAPSGDGAPMDTESPPGQSLNTPVPEVEEADPTTPDANYTSATRRFRIDVQPGCDNCYPSSGSCNSASANPCYQDAEDAFHDGLVGCIYYGPGYPACFAEIVTTEIRAMERCTERAGCESWVGLSCSRNTCCGNQIKRGGEEVTLDGCEGVCYDPTECLTCNEGRVSTTCLPTQTCIHVPFTGVPYCGCSVPNSQVQCGDACCDASNCEVCVAGKCKGCTAPQVCLGTFVKACDCPNGTKLCGDNCCPVDQDCVDGRCCASWVCSGGNEDCSTRGKTYKSVYVCEAECPSGIKCFTARCTCTGYR